MERLLPLCTNIQIPGRRITAYTRSTQPVNIHVARGRESRTNNWHGFWTGWESTVTPATDLTLETGWSRKRWPDWLLLLLLRQSLSECPAVSSYHTLVQKVYCIEVDPWNNTAWPCVVNSRVWWFTGKGKHPSRSYSWCAFCGAGSCHRTIRKMILGHPMVLPCRKLACNLKVTTRLPGLHWTVICRAHHLCVSEKRNVVIFLCSLVTLCYHESAWWGMQPDPYKTDTFCGKIWPFCPCNQIHGIWFPPKHIRVLELFVLWHTCKCRFFSCSQCFNRIRAGAYAKVFILWSHQAVFSQSIQWLLM